MAARHGLRDGEAGGEEGRGGRCGRRRTIALAEHPRGRADYGVDVAPGDGPMVMVLVLVLDEASLEVGVHRGVEVKHRVRGAHAVAIDDIRYGVPLGLVAAHLEELARRNDER